ncbi:MAG: glycosyltransferase family 39 protein [Lachnospiraceae bacterium]
MNIKFYSKNSLNLILLIILILCCSLRLVNLAALPNGVLPDEAYAAYNAFGLLTEGIDARGYTNPVYFVAWGSGMSSGYSYLSLPFLYFLGVSIFAFRLPMALLSICTCISMYVIGKELYDAKIGAIFFFFMTINPWHIMNSRFALDANLAPNLFLIAVCFLILGLKRAKFKYYIGFSIFTGLVLYGYAQSWIMMPLFIVLVLLYYWRELPKRFPLFLLGFIIFVFALPLLLFVIINMGYMDEIRTSWISIPKLASFRSDEVHLSNIISSLIDTIRVVLLQSDGISYTSSLLVGAYYTITTPFIILGILKHIKDFIVSLLEKKRDPSIVLFFGLISASIICLLNQNITIIHINLIHIPIIFYSCYGMIVVAEFFHNKYVIPLTCLCMSLSCILFYTEYATTYDSHFFDERSVEAIEAAKSLATDDTPIIISTYATIKYSNLFWTELPEVSRYYEEVIYTGDPGWQELESFDGFEYIATWSDATKPGIYIILTAERQQYAMLGYQIETINDLYALAY